MNEMLARTTEVNVVDILHILYRRKILIVGLTVLAGAVAAGVSLTMPNTYEASAALVVREPEDPMKKESEEAARSSEPPAFSVEMVQALAESTEARRALFDRMWSAKALSRWREDAPDETVAFSSFQGTLQTEVKAPQGQNARGAATLLPILFLRTRAQDPEEAKLIANEWAEIVTDKSRAIYTKDVEALNTFAGDVFQKSNDTLIDFEQKLIAVQTEAELETRQLRQQNFIGEMRLLQQRITSLETELESNTVLIQEGGIRAAAQEIAGEWVGSAAEKALRAGDDFEIDGEAPMRVQEILRTVRRFVEQTEDLRRFRLEGRLLTVTEAYNHYRWEIPRVREELSRARIDIAPARARLEELHKELSSVSETITLENALTADALWEAFTRDGYPKDSPVDSLKTQVVNPAYAYVQEQFSFQSAEVERLVAEADQLEVSLADMEVRWRELESELDMLRREVRRREKAIGDTEKLIATYRSDYMSEKDRIERLVVENERLKDEIAAAQRLTDSLTARVRKLDNEILDYEHRIEVLEREITKTKNVRNSLASKAEEVALLQVSAQQAAQTGTAILYNAEANPLKVGPARSRIVLGSMATALVVLGFLIVLAEMLRQQPGAGEPHGARL